MGKIIILVSTLLFFYGCNPSTSKSNSSIEESSTKKENTSPKNIQMPFRIDNAEECRAYLVGKNFDNGNGNIKFGGPSSYYVVQVFDAYSQQIYCGTFEMGEMSGPEDRFIKTTKDECYGVTGDKREINLRLNAKGYIMDTMDGTIYKPFR